MVFMMLHELVAFLLVLCKIKRLLHLGKQTSGASNINKYLS